MPLAFKKGFGAGRTPAEVMDSPLPTEPDDVKSRPPAASGFLLSRVISAPEPRRSDGPLSPSFDHTARKRDSPMDGPYPRSGAEPASPSANHFWPVAASSPRSGDFGHPPDKRPRLDYIPEKAGTQESLKRNILPHTGPSAHSPEVHPMLASDGSPVYRSSPGSCGNCADTESMVMELVHGFLELHSEIARALSLPSGRQSPRESMGSEVTKLGLRQSLHWTVTEIRNTTRLVQGNAAPKPGLPPLADVVPPPFVNDIQRLSIHGQTSAASPSINELRRMPLPPDSTRSEDFHRRGPDPHSVHMPRPYEHTLPSILQGEEMKRAQTYEQAGPVAGQSPHPSSSGSVFGSAQSPMPSQPSNRTLPSPPAAQYPRTGSSASMQYSPTTTPAAHHTHLQDLQHQISTRTLALQTLQREHDQLLAAFSRSQIRCTALDKKSQVSDHEINTLAEEKIRLQQQVGALESQVDDLVKSRNEAHQQSSADGAQWRQIVAMSSQLQQKGADEARQFRLERESWDRERASLHKRIEELESGKEILPEVRAASGASPPVANDSILTSGSAEVLREEIVRLRQRCAELELLPQKLAGETERIDNAIKAMESVRMSLAGGKRRHDDS